VSIFVNGQRDWVRQLVLVSQKELGERAIRQQEMDSVIVAVSHQQLPVAVVLAKENRFYRILENSKIIHVLSGKRLVLSSLLLASCVVAKVRKTRF
jgi:hypothetical protein